LEVWQPSGIGRFCHSFCNSAQEEDNGFRRG